ncbi:MAG: hypothetical protein FJ288_08475 [Planctomycetes bacterium]|nr:hypothetical protein [Planctomycetota bacterium]
MLAMAVVLAQVFEAGMLVCFGVAWPVDIARTLRTREVRGKSVGFMLLILGGYLSGMAAKFLRAGPELLPETVTALYAVNAALVAIDIALYYRFRPRALQSPRTSAME